MRFVQFVIITAFLILLVSLTTETAAAEGQLGELIEWIPVLDEPDRFWMAQKSHGVD